MLSLNSSFSVNEKSLSVLKTNSVANDYSVILYSLSALKKIKRDVCTDLHKCPDTHTAEASRSGGRYFIIKFLKGGRYFFIDVKMGLNQAKEHAQI